MTIALLCNGQELSYSDLETWSSGLAAQVLTWGAARERPVGILAPSSLEFAAALKGIWKAGAIAVPLQPNHPVPELEYILADSGLEKFFFHESCAELARSLKAEAIPIRKIMGSPVSHPSEGDAALMIYTSGTTSRPKGVITTYGGLDAQIGSLRQAWGWTAQDRILNVLPLHHVHGLVNVLACALASGATCELGEKFDPAYVWKRFQWTTLFMAVPTIYAKLIQFWESSDEQAPLSAAAAKLRLMVSGSAALPAPVSHAWLRITGHCLLERYGMTEIGMALSNPLHGVRKIGTVGKSLPGVSVRLLEGEIQVKGPTVFREYWRKPSQDCFTADGWFKTGDIAEIDAEGYYRILGRASQDILKSGGYKISALEIESALLENSQVIEAAVVGVPSDLWGEQVAAAYVGSAEPEELAAWLKEKIAAYKVPSLWKKVAALPRNAMGKALKPEIKKLF
ncbi:MAG: acyl-CoA synthetase [Bdellovibrionota bacterium]